MSHRPDVEKLHRACRDYIERAVDRGFTEREAWRMLNKLIFNELDRLARERRAKFKVIQGDRTAFWRHLSG
jgi:hypothetical protein